MKTIGARIGDRLGLPGSILRSANHPRAGQAINKGD